MEKALEAAGRRVSLCHGHLGGNGPLALQLCLILVEGLLSAVLHICARVVFGKTMLGREVRGITAGERSGLYTRCHRSRKSSGGSGPQS